MPGWAVGPGVAASMWNVQPDVRRTARAAMNVPSRPKPITDQFASSPPMDGDLLPATQPSQRKQLQCGKHQHEVGLKWTFCRTIEPAAFGWIATEVKMSVILPQVTTSFAGHAVQLALAMMARMAARASIRRHEREQADACVVMGV